MDAESRPELETLIGRWCASITERPAADATRLEAAERTLREQAASLMAGGLAPDEAFLIALKRVSASDDSTREFARAYSAGLLAAPAEAPKSDLAERAGASHFWIMMGCAVAGAVAIKVPALFGYQFAGSDMPFYVVNLSLFVLPFLALYFGWTRRLPARQAIGLAAIFLAGAVFANAYPFKPDGSTQVLTAIHLPIVLWLAVGVAFAAGDWRPDSNRMEYTRFTGEWFVDYVLIALGGGALAAITMGVFGAIGLNAAPVVEQWVLPCGAMGAVVVAAWLVETRRNPAGGMAPMLARVFTPLFALMLVALLVGVIWTKGFVDLQREVLIFFDLLLVVVLALLLYAFSSRDVDAGPDLFDRIQFALVVCALAVDVFALVGIAMRLSEFGVSPNKIAAVGLNVILLVNLAWSAFLQLGFIRGRRAFADIERWQMRYVPVYALWAAFVVVAFPPLFSFA